MKKIQQEPKPTRLRDWIGCSVIALIGIIILGIMLFASLKGTTPKEKLTSVTGVPVFAEASTVSGRYNASTDFLWFTIGDFKMCYGSDTKGYNLLKRSVEERLEVTLKVSTLRETIFARDGWVPIYEFISNGQTILSYEDSLGETNSGQQAGIVIGLVLLASSALGFKSCISNKRK